MRVRAAPGLRRRLGHPPLLPTGGFAEDISGVVAARRGTGTSIVAEITHRAV